MNGTFKIEIPCICPACNPNCEELSIMWHDMFSDNVMFAQARQFYCANQDRCMRMYATILRAKEDETCEVVGKAGGEETT